MYSATQFLAQQSPPGQDRLLVRRSHGKLFIAVADGAGGTSGGAEAADLAISLIESQIGSLTSEKACISMLKEIDSQVASDPVAGDTTLVVVVVDWGALFGASIGDSGAMLIGPESVIELTQHQIRKPFVGSGSAVPNGFRLGFSNGTLLVASDGLLKYTSREAIVSLIRTAPSEETASSLAELVRLKSGGFPEDISVAVVQLES